MRVSRWIGLMLCGLVAAAAHAQGYKWVDKRGHTQYGDIPPPGVKATPLGPPPPPIGSPASSAPAPSAEGKAGAAPEARKGPMTPAEQELEFRRRMKEAQEAAAKAEKERQQAREKEQNCERAKEALRTLQSGQRIARVDQKGERYYMSDQQRTAEAAQAREQVRQSCN
jgi:Domain of unknown function (DUF4124)